MRLALVDTETTGLDKEDQVIELAIISLAMEDGKLRRLGQYQTLIKPTCPVSVEARAVHHILDEELADKPTIQEFLQNSGFPDLGIPPLSEARLDDEDLVMVAHNEAFDRRMLVQSGIIEDLLPARRICTWRCAMHIWPDATSHSNQSLRYRLGIKLDVGDAHRALGDALVTEAILHEMIKFHDLETLIDLSSKPAMVKRVSFGKYRGRLWEEMDDGFLRWVLSKNFKVDEMHTAREILRSRGRSV